MKLIIQIPCYNEAQTLPETIKALPRQIMGIDQIELLVVDDGSTDGTSQVAKENGVDYFVRHPQHMGLAAGFVSGLDASLKYGVDIIVNTDADNQYQAEDIPRLVEPILSGRADIVVGDRGVATQKSFSPTKNYTDDVHEVTSILLRIVSENYKDIWFFIHDIENAPFPLRIDRLSGSMVTSRSRRHKTTSSSQVNIEVEITSVNFKK